MAADFVEAGVPILGKIEAPGDGRGRRHALAGRDHAARRPRLPHERRERAALAAALPGVAVMPFDLPHWHGAGEVLHLMSLISLLDDDLAVVYLPLLPVGSSSCSPSAASGSSRCRTRSSRPWARTSWRSRPRVGLALDGNPVTRRRMETAGVDVRVYKGDALSRLGDGGPTCLTRPLLRG